MFELNNIIIAFVLTTLAGLSIGLGGLLALSIKKMNKRFLCASLGFSAGVMIYVSFLEIFPEGLADIESHIGEKGHILGVIAFFVGVLIIGIMDYFIPSQNNEHDIVETEEFENKSTSAIKRVGVLSALAVAIHNLPEGMATFMAALTNPTLGISIAVAIAIHNIPIGTAISIPIFYGTGSRKKALKYSFLAGLAEPLGALIAFLFLMPFLDGIALGLIFCSVAGIMVYISIDELLPTALKYGYHHTTVYSFVLGMAIMAVSLTALH